MFLFIGQEEQLATQPVPPEVLLFLLQTMFGHEDYPNYSLLLARAYKRATFNFVENQKIPWYTRPLQWRVSFKISQLFFDPLKFRL